MKRVVSVSLGSSTRNKTVQVEFLGQQVTVQRIGADGSIDRAVSLIKELDGQVAAFGMGGIDLYIRGRTATYTLKAALPIVEAAKKSPMVDGGGLKHILEKRLINYLDSNGIYSLKGKKAFVVAGLGHFGLMDSLTARGCELAIGDIAFALGLPVMFRSPDRLDRVAKVVAPLVCQLPYSMLYPTGKQQESSTPRFGNWYHWSDFVTGDFPYMKRYMPFDMKGRAIITNTVTTEDIVDLRKRGITLLATFTPEMDGRSFGVNVMEALLVALSDKRREELTEADYEDLVEKLDMQPRIEWLNG